MKKGFTLIELLVVVLIIGILGAIALPQYQKAVAKSRVSSAFPTLRAIKDAYERYYVQSGGRVGWGSDGMRPRFSDLDVDLSGCEVYGTFAYCNGKEFYIGYNHVDGGNEDSAFVTVMFPKYELSIIYQLSFARENERIAPDATRFCLAITYSSDLGRRICASFGGREITDPQGIGQIMFHEKVMYTIP